MAPHSRGPRTLSDIAEQRLRDAIFTGELPPGSPIHIQDQVEQLEMSHVPIREALRYLEHSGLIERRPHHPMTVAPMSVKDLLETCDMRITLETLAIRRAAEKITIEEQAHLEGLLQEYSETFQAATDLTRQLHRGLHMAIYATADSAWLGRTVTMLWDNCERYQRLNVDSAPPAEVLADHGRLVELCATHDLDGASAALETHIRGNIEGIIRTLREEDHADVSD